MTSAAIPDVRQGGLFEDRWLRMVAVHHALDRFDLEAACEALQRALPAYPANQELAERAGVVARLARRLSETRKQHRSLALALVAIQGDIPPFLVSSWHRCLAQSMEAEAGPGAVLAGEPAGLHWFEAGELASAEASLRATLASHADSRAQAYLADVLSMKGRSRAARILYRDALASNPLDVNVGHIVDVDVCNLPSIAAIEYEVTGDPVEWAATVGVIEGTFVAPHAAAHRNAGHNLPAGLAFYDAIARESGSSTDAERIDARRAMKALAPTLLSRYLQRYR